MSTARQQPKNPTHPQDGTGQPDMVVVFDSRRDSSMPRSASPGLDPADVDRAIRELTARRRTAA